MTPTLVWAILLLAAAVAVIGIEMFVPSGGILGIVAVSLAVGGVALMFWQEGFVHGTLFLLATCIVIPFVVATAIRHWPHTAMGRRILNLPPGEEAAVAAAPNYEGLKQLIGQRGLAKSKMLPSGTISLGGKFYDAVSQSGAIQPGQPIQIVAVDGTRILVRELEQTEAVANADQIIPDPFED